MHYKTKSMGQLSLPLFFFPSWKTLLKYSTPPRTKMMNERVKKGVVDKGRCELWREQGGNWGVAGGMGKCGIHQQIRSCICKGTRRSIGVWHKEGKLGEEIGVWHGEGKDMWYRG